MALPRDPITEDFTKWLVRNKHDNKVSEGDFKHNIGQWIYEYLAFSMI